MSRVGITAAFVGLAVGAIGWQLGQCAGERERKRLAATVNDLMNDVALADSDRVEAIDSTHSLTNRLTLVQEALTDEQRRTSLLAQRLDKTSERLVSLSQIVAAYTAKLEASTGTVVAAGDTLITASFEHRNEVLQARTEALLRRPAVGTAWAGSESLEILGLRLPLEMGQVILEDGAVEARAVCAAENCTVSNVRPSVLLPGELVEGLRKAGRWPEEDGGLSPVTSGAIGGGVGFALGVLLGR